MKEIEEIYSEIFRIAHNNLSVALLIVDKIPVDKHDICILIEFQDSIDPIIQLISREIALRIPKENIDYKKLYRRSTCGNNSIRNFSSLIIMEKFPEKLVPNTILGFLESQNSIVVNLAGDILRTINIELFDYTLLISDLDSLIDEKRKIIREMILRIPIELLDFKVLINKFKTTGVDGQKFIYNLAMMIPKDSLDFDFLLSLKESYITDDLASLILLDKFSEKLDYKMLILMQESRSEFVRDMAKIVARKLSADNFDYIELIHFQEYENSHMSSLSRELAFKVPVEKLDFIVLGQFYNSKNVFVSMLAMELLFRMPIKKQIHSHLEVAKANQFIEENFGQLTLNFS